MALFCIMALFYSMALFCNVVLFKCCSILQSGIMLQGGIILQCGVILWCIILQCGIILQDDMDSDNKKDLRKSSKLGTEWLHKHKVKSFYNVVSAPDFRLGAQALLQVSKTSHVPPARTVYVLQTGQHRGMYGLQGFPHPVHTSGRHRVNTEIWIFFTFIISFNKRWRQGRTK